MFQTSTGYVFSDLRGEPKKGYAEIQKRMKDTQNSVKIRRIDPLRLIEIRMQDAAQPERPLVRIF